MKLSFVSYTYMFRNPRGSFTRTYLPSKGMPSRRRYYPAISAGFSNRALYGAAAAGAASVAAKWFSKPRKTQTRRKAPYGVGRVIRNRRSVKKQVKELKRVAESSMGLLTFRDTESHACVSSGINQQTVTLIPGVTATEQEEVLAQLRYYNPAAPTTLTTADGTTGAYQKEFYFSTEYTKFQAINNYQVPVYVSIYICQVKKDTNITPQAAWSQGLTDISNGTINSVNIYPTDSQQFNDLFKIVKSKKCYLQPGQLCEMSHSNGKKYQYDPSLFDSHSLTYQSRYNNYSYLVTVNGPMGHDTAVVNEQGLLQSGVDIRLDRTFKVKYNAGADIKFVYVTSTLDTFTNGGVISNKPVSDNQTYSVA